LRPRDPKHGSASALLARQVGVVDAAVQSLGRAVELAPDVPEYRIQHAGALQEKGLVEQAAEEFRIACRLRPNDASAWEQLGVALQGMGDVDAAADAYRRAYRLVPARAHGSSSLPIVSPIIASREAMLSQRAAVEAELASLLSEPALPYRRPDARRVMVELFPRLPWRNDRSLQLDVCGALSSDLPDRWIMWRRTARERATREAGYGSVCYRNFSTTTASAARAAGCSRSCRERSSTSRPFSSHRRSRTNCSRFIREHAEHTLVVPQDLARARSMIEALELDVLFTRTSAWIRLPIFWDFRAWRRCSACRSAIRTPPEFRPSTTSSRTICTSYPAPPRTTARSLFLLHGLGSLAYYYRPDLPQPHKRRAISD
jgi:hypothetical protein